MRPMLWCLPKNSLALGLPVVKFDPLVVVYILGVSNLNVLLQAAFGNT